MKTIDVTALGELLIDFTESGYSPQHNRLLEVNPGGAPCNVLSMLSKLGHRTCFIGKIGQDMFGDLLQDALTEVGIGTEGLLRDPKVPTTLAFVHTHEDGDREFSFYRNPGADMMLGKEELNFALIEQAKIFHFGTLSMTHETCRDATKEAVRIAQNAGCLISFDPNLREPLWDSLDTAREQVEFGLHHCHILKISDNEIQWFTGETDYDAGITLLQERYHIPLILVSLGKEGSIACCAGSRVFVPAFQTPHTIETTGAGDTFAACVLHYVLQHMEPEQNSEQKWHVDPGQYPEQKQHVELKQHPEQHPEQKQHVELKLHPEVGLAYDGAQLQEMLRFANAAASIVTTRKGALKAMPELQEVLQVVNGNSAI